MNSNQVIFKTKIMKKIILSLALTLVSFFSFSQDFYKVGNCKIENYINDKWVTVETTYPKKMFVIIKGSNIKVTNEAGSSFQTYGEVVKEKYSTHIAYIWRGYDDEAQEVFIFLKTSGDFNTLVEFSVMYYNKTCYVYNLTQQ